METLILTTLVLAGFYVGWNIGANDAANCIGTTVGARIITYRKAVVIMAVMVILGGVLQGHHVMKTVGKGLPARGSNSISRMTGSPTRQSWWHCCQPGCS